MDREVADEQYVVRVLTTSVVQVVAYSPADTLAARAMGAAIIE